MNRFDRFQQLIDEPEPPPNPHPAAEIVHPLVDFAAALEARARVGARVQSSEDGRRHHLALWPLHRPAFRHIMVTVHVANGRGAVSGEPMFWFTNADELTGWLEHFMQGPAFKATLSQLRFAATEPVDARLERANGMATLAVVTPEQQEALDRLQVGEELSLALPLHDQEPLPDLAALRVLNTAGLKFAIRDPSLMGRTVQLRAVRLP
ncbi:hypothetical protein [Sorangium sp. So ce381]|uniref:hypothetical protein n=1 Tax=Sorangium sp. So ce381 TaxID=3133307 RepID=UPI003F5B2EA0